MTTKPRRPSRTLHGLVGRAWTPSMREEVLAALYLIAGLEAWQAGIRWLAWCLFFKAANDTVCALVAAVAEIVLERKANAPAVVRAAARNDQPDVRQELSP